MALYITCKDPENKVRGETQWWVNRELEPLIPGTITEWLEVLENPNMYFIVQADLDELLWIRTTFNNLLPASLPDCVWYGDVAKMIVRAICFHRPTKV